MNSSSFWREPAPTAFGESAATTVGPGDVLGAPAGGPETAHHLDQHRQRCPSEVPRRSRRWRPPRSASIRICGKFSAKTRPEAGGRGLDFSFLGRHAEALSTTGTASRGLDTSQCSSPETCSGFGKKHASDKRSRSREAGFARSAFEQYDLPMLRTAPDQRDASSARAASRSGIGNRVTGAISIRAAMSSNALYLVTSSIVQAGVRTRPSPPGKPRA